MQSGGSMDAVWSYVGRAGAGGAAANVFNVHWTGSAAALWIDGSNVGNITRTSDRRVKNNIEPLTLGLAEILKLRPQSFEWIDTANPPGPQFGLIAQDVATILPTIATQTTLKHALAPDGLWWA